MSAWHARAFDRQRRVSRAAAPQDARRLAIGREAERFRLFAGPFEPGARTVDLEAQIVEIAERDLARRQHATRSALKPKQHVRVIVEAAARHEGREFR